MIRRYLRNLIRKHLWRLAERIVSVADPCASGVHTWAPPIVLSGEFPPDLVSVYGETYSGSPFNRCANCGKTELTQFGSLLYAAASESDEIAERHFYELQVIARLR